MRAIREISLDLAGRTEVELASGRRMTAPAIQRTVRERVLASLDPASLDDLHRYVADLWGRGIEAIESGDWSGVDTELDIAIKRKLLTAYAAKAGTTLADPRVARLELSYHDITAQGLLPKMERAGLVRRLTTDEGVRRALTTAPETTRARLRGRIIAAAEDARADLTVDWVHARLDDQQIAPLTLNDPLANEDPRVDDLIARISSAAPVLPA